LKEFAKNYGKIIRIPTIKNTPDSFDSDYDPNKPVKNLYDGNYDVYNAEHILNKTIAVQAICNQNGGGSSQIPINDPMVTSETNINSISSGKIDSKYVYNYVQDTHISNINYFSSKMSQPSNSSTAFYHPELNVQETGDNIQEEEEEEEEDISTNKAMDCELSNFDNEKKTLEIEVNSWWA